MYLNRVVDPCEVVLTEANPKLIVLYCDIVWVLREWGRGKGPVFRMGC